MPAADRFQVYLDEDSQSWLLGRAAAMMQGDSVPRQAALELDLWCVHLAAELTRVTWRLGEIGCIADVLNAPMIEPTVSAYLWAELADAFDGLDGEYGRKWGVDEDALVAMARTLGPTACHALAGAVHQWWTTPECKHDVDGWRAVGLRVIE